MEAIVSQWMRECSSDCDGCDARDALEWTAEQCKMKCVQRFVETRCEDLVRFVAGQSGQDVDLSGKSLKFQDMQIIAAALRPEHRTLDVSNNGIDARGMRVLAGALAAGRGTGLRLLHIGDNPGTAEMFREVLAAWGAPDAPEMYTVSAESVDVGGVRVGPGYPQYMTGRRNACLLGDTPRQSVLTGCGASTFRVNVSHPEYTASCVPEGLVKLSMCGNVEAKEEAVKAMLLQLSPDVRVEHEFGTTGQLIGEILAGRS